MVQQKFMFLCVEHSPVNVQFRCNSFLWLGNQFDFFLSPSAYAFNIFPKNRMMMELNCCSRLDKFINVISQIMIPNKCGSTGSSSTLWSEASSIPPLP